MSHKKNFIVLSGIPGTGKSLLRSKLVKTIPNVFVLSTDDIIDDWAQSQGKTYSEIWEDSIQKADKVSKEMFSKAIEEGKNIIVDRTNLSPKSRKQHLSIVSPKEYNFQCIQIIKPQTEKEVSDLKDRLEIRAQKEGKIIPDELLETFLENFQLVTDDEPFSDYMFMNMYGRVIEKEHSQNFKM
jgi:predicted kinase